MRGSKALNGCERIAAKINVAETAELKAIEAARLAMIGDGTHRVSLDQVIRRSRPWVVGVLIVLILLVLPLLINRFSSRLQRRDTPAPRLDSEGELA